MRGLLAAVLICTAGAAMAATAVIRGAATFDAAESLPAGAMLEVDLLDTSEATAEPLASDRVEIRRRGAVPFVLRYDPDAIDQGRNYVLSARLVSDGRTIFRADPYPVINGGTGNVAVIEMFSTQRQRPRQSQSQSQAEPDLLIGTWTAEEIGGAPRTPGVASFITLTGDGKVRGRGGCNSFSGRWEVVDGVLTIGPLGATRRACPPPTMDQEARFFSALESARGFRMQQGLLVLLDADGAALARLDRQA